MKRFIQLMIFILLTAFCLGKAYGVLSWKDTNVSYQSCVLQLAETPNDSIDAVFVGSSHVYTGIYPSYLWSSFGISAFDMAICAMDRDSAYYSIKHLFKTQSPRVVMVDLFSLTFETHVYKEHFIRNYLTFPISEDTIPALNAYAAKDPAVSENYLDYLTRWPVFHTRYRELERRDFINDEAALAARGEYLNWAANVIEPITPPAPSTSAALSEDQLNWLKELDALCRENDASLVLMALPFQSDEDKQALIDSAFAFAEENGIPRLDFNRRLDELDLDYNEDFFDDAHPNAYGAKKICAFLGNYLKENYELADHRGDPAYGIWDEDLRYYEHRRDGDALAAASEDLEETLAILSRMKEVTAVISLEGIYQDSALYESLRILPGISEEDYNAGGKWIWENGELTLLMHNDTQAAPYIRELDDYVTLQVRFTGTRSGHGSILLGRDDHSNYEGQLSIVVYDSFLHSTLLAKEYTIW
ncbi:MAG: hypothetical protein K6E50_09750 [Lachnospiraceae bacterium]|nr:hypothetical protein [Lachnospiraceae bacterium]